MAESEVSLHYETLQVSPSAEPEVIAAAYRALAKKYHPDRSDAPDSMARMARLNVAYQALKGNAGRITSVDSRVDSFQASSRPFSQENIDPSAPLEEIMAAVARMVASARQRIIDGVTEDGVSRDVATSLVATALRSFASDAQDSRRDRSRSSTTRIDPSASYDEALNTVMQRATAMRDQLADDLVKDGLNRGTAQELADSALERLRRKIHHSGTAETRLTPDRVDLSGPLEAGVRVVSGKVQAARQLVLDELTRDGIPIHTATQLVQAAYEAKGQARRTS